MSTNPAYDYEHDAYELDDPKHPTWAARTATTTPTESDPS